MNDPPVLLLLAGLLCDGTIWEPVAAELADVADIRILAFPNYSSIGAMAESVLAQAPPRFALAGHSMGARIALEVHARAPGRVERIALLNTGVHPTGAQEPAARGRLVALSREQGMTALAGEWLPPMMGSGLNDAALMARLATMVERSTPESFAGQTAALLARPNATAALDRVTVPTLLVSGTQDRWSPVAQHQAMQARLPHARLVVIEGAGHMAPVEQPAAVARALREWLEEA